MLFQNKINLKEIGANGWFYYRNIKHCIYVKFQIILQDILGDNIVSENAVGCYDIVSMLSILCTLTSR